MANWWEEAEPVSVAEPELDWWELSVPAGVNELNQEIQRLDVRSRVLPGMEAAKQYDVPNLYSGLMQGSRRAASLGLRALGQSDLADRAVREAQAFEQIAGEMAAKETKYPLPAQTMRGVTASLPTMAALGATGGTPAVFIGAGALEGNEAYTEAKDAGLPEDKAMKYAAVQGLIEGGVGAAFQKIPGMGGTESLFTKQVQQEIAKQGLRDAAKQAGLRTLAELPEELLTEIGHNVAGALSGVEPQALSRENVLNTIASTTAQTLATAGLMESPGLGRASAKAIYDKLDPIVRKRIAAKQQPSRKDFADAGLPSMSAAERAMFAKRVRDAVARETGGAESPAAAGERMARETISEVDKEMFEAGWTRDPAGGWRPPTQVQQEQQVAPESLQNAPVLQKPDEPKLSKYEQIGQELGGISHLTGIISRLAEVYDTEGPDAGLAYLEYQAPGIFNRLDGGEGEGNQAAIDAFVSDLDGRLRKRLGIENLQNAPVLQKQPSRPMTPAEIEQIIQQGIPPARQPVPQQLPPMEIGPEGQVEPERQQYVGKKPWEATEDELDEAIRLTKDFDRQVEVEVFGEEGAKRYRNAYRKSNSTFGSRASQDEGQRIVDEMEAGLTEQQRNRLFGIGEAVVDADELKAIRNALSNIGADSPAELGRQLFMPLIKLAGKTDADSMTTAERAAVAQINKAKRWAQEEGWDFNVVGQEAMRGLYEKLPPEDADFIAQQWLDVLPQNAPAAQATPAALPAPEPIPAEQPKQLPPYRRQPADYMPGQAHGWLHDAVSRRPAGLNTPQEIADWINKGFPQGNWRSYAEQQGHTSLEQSVAKVMDELTQQRVAAQEPETKPPRSFRKPAEKEPTKPPRTFRKPKETPSAPQTRIVEQGGESERVGTPPLRLPAEAGSGDRTGQGGQEIVPQEEVRREEAGVQEVPVKRGFRKQKPIPGMDLPAERRTDYDDLSEQIRKFANDDEAARHAPYFAELDRIAAETPVTDDFDDHDASEFQANAEGAADIQEEIDGRLNDLRTIAAERAMAKWTKRKMEAEQVTEPDPEEEPVKLGQTVEDYKQNFPNLTLTQLYQEQDRYEKQAEQWDRIPSGKGQADTARKFSAAIEEEVNRRYKEGIKANEPKGAAGTLSAESDQKLYQTRIAEEYESDPEMNDYTAVSRALGVVLASKGVKPSKQYANRQNPLGWELSSDFHDPLVSYSKDTPLEKVVRGMEMKSKIDREPHIYKELQREAGVLAQTYSLSSEEVVNRIEADRRGGKYSITGDIEEGLKASAQMRRRADILAALAGETDTTKDIREWADKIERLAEGKKSRLDDAYERAKEEIADRPRKNTESLKPLETKGSRVNDAWEGEVTAENSPYISDGRVMILRKSISDKDAEVLRKAPQKGRKRSKPAKPEFVKKTWQTYVTSREMVSAESVGVLTAKSGAYSYSSPVVDYAYFRAGDDIYVYPSGQVAYISRITKADGYQIGIDTEKDEPSNSLIFMRGGKPVAFIGSELPGGPKLDISALPTGAGPQPKRSFRKGDQQMAAVQRERLPGEVSARVKPLPPTETEQAVSVHDIVETIKRDFKVPIRRGKLPSKALGIYRYLPEVIRTQGAHAGNLYVVTHELGHHLDKTTDVRDGVPDDANAELAANDYEPKGRHDEGFAEFIRMYTTTENAEVYLPRFTEHFEKWLGKNPEIKKKVDRVRRLATKWRSMTPEGRALAQIWGQKRKPEALETSMLDTVAGAMNAAEHTYTKMMDKTYFVHKLAKASGAANARDTASSAEILSAYEMAAPSRAESALLHGPDTVTENYRKLGPGLQEAFDKHIKSPKDYDSWKAWMLADHTLYMEEKNPAFRTGLDPQDAKQIVNATDETTANRYRKLQAAFVDFNNNLLDVAVDAGVHSADEAKRMKDYYGDHYLPLMRIRDEKMVSRLTRRFFNIKTPFRSRSKKGSNLPVMDFLEATILRTMSTYEASMRQFVLDRLIRETVPEYGGAESLGKFIEKIPPGMKPTEAELGELLDQLVETGIVDEEYAQTLKAVDALRNGRMQNKLIPWLAAKYGIDLSQDDAIEDLRARTDDIPSLESEIVIWRPVYRTSDTERIFRHVINGKPALFKIDNGLWDSFSGMAPLSMHPFLQTFGQINRLFKMGATGIKPTFPLVNMIRDLQVFLVQEKHLKGTRRITEPFRWTAIFAMSELNRMVKNFTGKSIFEDNEVAELFDEVSGKIVNSLGVTPASVSSMRKSVARKSGWASKGEAAKAGAYRLLQGVRDVVGLMESGPRLAAFNSYLESVGYKLKDGKITKDGVPTRPTQSELVRALNEARDVTTNFVRSGSAGRFIDQFIPFFNASIQSQDKEIRTLLESGKDIKAFIAGKALTGAGKRVLSFLVGGAALQTLYWLMRHDDDDYEEMPWWLKYGYWTLNIDGKPVAKIPRAHTWNTVPVMTEAVLNSLNKKDASELAGAMEQQFGMRNPISGPAGITPAVEATFNFDTFRWRNIENQSLLKLPPQYRYRSDTSETAKAIGHVTGQYGFGPLKVEHVLNQTTGGLIPSLGKYPWSGVLQRHEPMRSVDEFYDEKEKVEQQATAEKVIHKRDNPELDAKASDMNRYSAMMTEMRAAIRDEKDRDKRFETEKYMVGLARYALGKEPLERYPNPLTTKNSPEHIAKLRREEIMRRAEKMASYTPETLTDLEKEVGITLDEKKKAWEQEVEASRKWLQEIGADPAEVRILYKIRLDSMKDKVTVARKLGRVEGLMQGGEVKRSWRPR